MDSESTGSKTSNPSSKSERGLKAASAPLHPVESSEAQLKPQISAPSYLYSLKDNDAPPFKKPGKEAKPKLLQGTIMTESEAVEMVAVADGDKVNGLQKWLGDFLVEKNIILNYQLSEKRFLISLLSELVDYAAQRDYSAHKLSVLMTIYLATHLYFKWYYWVSPVDVWHYFKEVMIRHTVEDSPSGEHVFDPDECFDVMTHFHTIYLANLPLVHILTHGVYRLKLRWPFKLNK